MLTTYIWIVHLHLTEEELQHVGCVIHIAIVALVVIAKPIDDVSGHYFGIHNYLS